MANAKTARTRYEVAVHFFGRRMCRRDGPCQGLLDWPEHKWTRLTARPLGLQAAIALANAQEHHSVVAVWGTAQKTYDNGKLPAVPVGWYPADKSVA